MTRSWTPSWVDVSLVIELWSASVPCRVVIVSVKGGPQVKQLEEGLAYPQHPADGRLSVLLLETWSGRQWVMSGAREVGACPPPAIYLPVVWLRLCAYFPSCKTRREIMPILQSCQEEEVGSYTWVLGGPLLFLATSLFGTIGCSSHSANEASLRHLSHSEGLGLFFRLWLICVELRRWFRFLERRPSCQVDPETRPWAAVRFSRLASALQSPSCMDIPEWAENKGPFTSHISLSNLAAQ